MLAAAACALQITARALHELFFKIQFERSAQVLKDETQCVSTSVTCNHRAQTADISVVLQVYCCTAFSVINISALLTCNALLYMHTVRTGLTLKKAAGASQKMIV
jgi:hypothetical protein